MTDETLRLRWAEPAAAWSEATPVGNGRLGGMVFGGARARLQINDATVWSGTPDTPAAGLADVVAQGAGPERLQAVRRAIDAGDLDRARDLVAAFEGGYSQEFLPFADLTIATGPDGAPVSYAGRVLDLDAAVVREEFDVGDVHIVRRWWASAPDAAICVETTATGGPIDLRIAAATPLRLERRVTDTSGLRLGISIPVDGAPLHESDLPAHVYATDDAAGFDPYAALAVAVSTDGNRETRGDELLIRSATHVLVTISSATNAELWWADSAARPDRGNRDSLVAYAAERAATALGRGSAELFRRHSADIDRLLGTTRVRIGHQRDGVIDVPELLDSAGDDLVATVMLQYGRYLLASASRPGNPPANLQGIWNDQERPAWSSNYTININTQMNYWAAEAAGLGESHLPLVELLEKLTVTGGEAAERLYGARGWVAHHNVDMWGWALPVGRGAADPSWAIWMMGGAWLSRHAWEHYAYSLDLRFLRDRGWPILAGAARFVLDWLIETEDGRLATSPSTSPENHYLAADGRPQALTTSSAMDMALAADVLRNALSAAEALELDDELCERMRVALPRVGPAQIAPDGRLREWSADLPEEDRHHRHLSHLVRLYPIGEIDVERTPELAAAAARSLDARGPGAMGWSWSWKIALRARLGDGEEARSLLLEATTPLSGDPSHLAPVDGSEWGGLLPNLFSTHPPFQIDGNYGFVAGIIEMLVQDAGDTVRLLPALPAAWREGEVRGVRLRGGLEVDLSWRDGRLETARIRANASATGRPLRILAPGHEFVETIPPGRTVDLTPGITDGSKAAPPKKEET
ncbi:MAG: hypothetical protein JWM49_1425 [Microbacteriaceae bacterium]|nr:hypothetical protein [Microbacteriaceae bacterium]